MMDNAKLTERQIDELLKTTKGNDYNDWFNMGMTLHAHYGSDMEGLRKWDKWSSNFNGYEKKACHKMWKIFKT